jgi:hypothetical protein
MAEDPATEAARKQLVADREVTEKSRAEYASRMKGKPTPTQEENDIAVLGGHLLEKEDDGSGPDLGVRSLEGGKPAAAYQTRSAQGTPRPPARPPSA